MEEEKPHSKYWWLSSTTHKISSIYNSFSKTLAENLSLEIDSEEEIQSECPNNEVQYVTISSTEKDPTTKAEHKLFHYNENEYNVEPNESVDIPLDIDDNSLSIMNNMNIIQNINKNERTVKTVDNEEINTENHIVESPTEIHNSVEETQLDNNDNNKNISSSSSNDNLCTDLENVNDQCTQVNETATNVVEDNEKKNNNDQNDKETPSEEAHNYPATTLSNEDATKIYNLRKRIRKLNAKCQQQVNTKNTKTLATIDEDTDYHSYQEEQDTGGEFELVISKKNKKRNKSKTKTYVTCESKDTSIGAAADASDKARKTEEEARKHQVTSTVETNYLPKVSNNKRQEKHTIQNLNSYAPLDPNNHISPERYKKVIAARRELLDKLSVDTPESKVDDNKIYKVNSIENQNNCGTVKNLEHNNTNLQIRLNKLTLRQYFDNHRTIGLNKNMPLLTTKTKQLPLMKQLIGNEKSRQKDGKQYSDNELGPEWNQIGDKKAEEQLLDIYEVQSDRWLPRNLPRTTRVNDNTIISKTTKVLPISIKMTSPKSTRQQVQVTRLLLAVLGAMQQQFKDTYIAPIVIEKAPIITSLVDIPTDESLLQHYIEWPSVELIVHSNHNLGQYKEIAQFRQYLSREHIVLDYNNLDSIDPVHVGFIQQLVPRYETLHLHHARLTELLPIDAPMFQRNIQSIYGRSGERSKAIMVNCDKHNENTLKIMFNKLHKEEHVSFYPWKEYITLDYNLKEIIIRKQNMFLNNVRSIILSGFLDNNDNVPMYMADDEHLEDLRIAIREGTTDEYNSKDYIEGFEAIGVTECLQNYVYW
jgi:hypothetical protein